MNGTVYRINERLRSKKIVIDGKVESLYVYFREEFKIFAALEFDMPNGRIAVYVDRNDMPVGAITKSR